MLPQLLAARLNNFTLRGILLNYLAEDSGETALSAGNAAAGDSEVVRGDLCPDYGNATVKHAEGCSKCESCAWSEC
jgi:hypothetical protein